MRKRSWIVVVIAVLLVLALLFARTRPRLNRIGKLVSCASSVGEVEQGLLSRATGGAFNV